MQYDLMIDLETFGNNSNSIIVSIGAVVFSLDTSQIYDTLYSKVDTQSAYDLGLEFSPSTVMWWMKQSSEARSKLNEKGETIQMVLSKLSNFVKPYSNLTAWGKGPEFDLKILETAYEKAQLPLPWKYYSTDSVRSYYRLNRKLNLGITETKPTVAHDSLSDAIAQTQTVIEIYNKLRSFTNG